MGMNCDVMYKYFHSIRAMHGRAPQFCIELCGHIKTGAVEKGVSSLWKSLYKDFPLPIS